MHLTVKRNRFLKLILFSESIFSFEFFMSYFLGIQLDILIGAFTGMKYARVESFANFFNMMVSLVVIIFYGVVTVLISIKVWVLNKKYKDKVDELHKFTHNKKWDFLHLNVKKEIPFASYVIAMNVIKDFIISPIIVFGIESAAT